MIAVNRTVLLFDNPLTVSLCVESALAVNKRRVCLARGIFKLLSRLIIAGAHLFTLIKECTAALAKIAVLLVSAARDARVDIAVGKPLQKFAALIIAGFEERAEFCLRQQYGTGELVEA